MSEMSVRMPLCRTAEKSNIPWREMTKEVLESDVYDTTGFPAFAESPKLSAKTS